MTHLDTSFLVDLLRETTRGKPGPASSFLDALEGEEIAISVHVACELYAGAELAQRRQQEGRRIEGILANVTLVYPDERFAARYGIAFAALRRAGHSISSLDLLIGTAALIDEAPLVTRNRKDFAKIPGLELLEY